MFRITGRIRLSVSTVNRTYELSGITHVTSFRKYGKHSTGPSTYGPWVRTYSKLFSSKSVLTVCSYRAQSNEIHAYGRVSHGSIPRVRIGTACCTYGQSNTTNVSGSGWSGLRMQRDLHKPATEVRGLSRQMVFPNREIKHDFCQNRARHGKINVTSAVSLNRFHKPSVSIFNVSRVELFGGKHENIFAYSIIS